MRFRDIAKDLCPPFIVRSLRKIRPAATEFLGDFPDFDAASKEAEGYTSANIIPAVVAAFQKTDLRSSFLDERTIQLLAAFATIPGPVKVLDYGGASGVYFYLLSRYLSYALDWTVLETTPMVEAFRALKLPNVRHTAEVDGPYDVALFSGSLQYLRKPYETLSALTSDTQYVIFNRLSLIPSFRDRLTVQKTAIYYKSSYPAWFFSQERFTEFVSRLGTITMQWTLTTDVAALDGKLVPYSGLVLKLK